MAADSKVIWTPDGQMRVTGDATRVELKSTVGEWLRQFADVAQALGLGIHCAKCKGDLVGKNSDSAAVYGVSCGCRDFVWRNRDYRPGEPTVN
jgi:hypothetical protein